MLNKTKYVGLSLLGTLVGVCFGNVAYAHVSVASGPATANVTQVVTFGVGHGCEGADTMRVTVDIPTGVTSVRPMPSEFGAASVTRDLANVVTSVTWQRPVSEVLSSDDDYYELKVRLKPPNNPFTTIYFLAHQTCRQSNGTLTTVDWVGLPGMTAPDGGALEPAAGLLLLPARQPGWNRYTIPVTLSMTDLSNYFRDALIVWKGTQAYSINTQTTALIMRTPGVTALTSLSATDEVWVRY